MKILYVCPFAHYSGHHPYVATVEPGMLAKTGSDVALVTFCGITNNPKIPVKHYTVTKDNKFYRKIRSKTIPRWFLMLIETTRTLVKAIQIYKKQNYDIIYVRDGEPFLFMMHILSFFYFNCNWAISLTGAMIYTPKLSKFKLRGNGNPFTYIYILVMHMLRGNIWWPLYKLSSLTGKFVYMTQNNEAKIEYSRIMNGVFNKKVKSIPLGMNQNTRLLSKQEAREHLNLPQDKVILLSFGAPHSGKKMSTVFEAIKATPDVFGLFAGTQSFSLGSIPSKLAEEYNLNGRVSVRDYYVPEEEKPYFFLAADVLILSYTKIFKSTSSMLWEAAGYNLPVISSDANTLGEIVKKYNLGLLFEAENSESLASSIHEFIDISNEDINNIKAGCIRFTNDYSYKIWANNCIEVFKELIA